MVGKDGFSCLECQTPSLCDDIRKLIGTLSILSSVVGLTCPVPVQDLVVVGITEAVPSVLGGVKQKALPLGILAPFAAEQHPSPTSEVLPYVPGG